MFKKVEKKLLRKIDDLNKALTRSNILEMTVLLGSKKELFKRNFIAGVARGIGIGIGVTVITAVLVLLLRKIVSLNIPIIGEYIADIVEIVQRSR